MLTDPPPFPSLRPGRVHEASGPAATGFAAMLCAGLQGPLLWIRPGWHSEIASPDGLSAMLSLDRLLVVQTQSETDSLAIAEEGLRDGALGCVVIGITRPLSLREGRRLQLAAKAGGTTGLCLIPEGMGSNAAETRWHCSPVFSAGEPPDSTLMRWQITKNKSGTIGAWHVRWNPQTHRLDLVSPAPLGPGPAGLPG